ncbi:MAG: hypothetical protein AAFN13_17230, partial [Bacteroidota bacterium]
MRTALCLLAALLLVAYGCDSTSVPRDNLSPGLVAGTYVGSAELSDGLASRFTITLTPASGAASGTTASVATASASAGSLSVDGLLLRNSVEYAVTGSGIFDYPAVALAAKAPSLGAGNDGFSFTLTTDASGTVLQGEVNGRFIKLDKQR